jgi:hypothetical protein
MKVIVIKNNLRYRIPGYKKGAGFIPKIGDMVTLPLEVAKKELGTGNVRKLLKEEQELYEKKRAARKEKKEKKRKKG